MKWLQLMRAANAPTAAANILAAFLLANGDWTHWPTLLLLILSSVALYSCGMVLNDVFDFHADTQTQPHRPLPAGKIQRSTANALGWALMLTGILLALAAGISSGVAGAPLQATIVATALAGTIYLYDGPLKKTALAPALMGSCRSLNFLLGAVPCVLASPDALPRQTIGGFPPEVLWVAGSIGVLITGVTLLARNETRSTQNRVQLGFASAVILLGFALLAALPWCPHASLPLTGQQAFVLLIGLVASIPLRRIVICLFSSTPGNVKSAIISNLRSLIILDASICFLARPDNLVFALVVLMLLIPVLVLSNWLYST